MMPDEIPFFIVRKTNNYSNEYRDFKINKDNILIW